MDILCRGFCALATALLMSGAANAVPVDVAGSLTFMMGTGYGVDAVGVEKVPVGLPGGGTTNLNGGQGGTLLDVVFPAAVVFPAVGSGSFTLPGPGSSKSFSFDVTLNERYIDPAELDNLGITAVFTIALPFAGVRQIIATGTAIAGPVANLAGSPLFDPLDTVDLTIDWASPLDVAFGGGVLRIDMNDLIFTGLNITSPVGALGAQTLQETVTVTLLAVPEPATVALFGLGLAGLGWGRRRR